MSCSQRTPATQLLPRTSTDRKTHSFSPAYDNEEPDFDPDEPAEPFDPDEEQHQVDDLAVGQNPDQLLTTGERSVIESGDLEAGIATKIKGKTPKDKKIPKDQRTTTPYMTKYERARILGTRALQIRFVEPHSRREVGNWFLMGVIA